ARHVGIDEIADGVVGPALQDVFKHRRDEATTPSIGLSTDPPVPRLGAILFWRELYRRPASSPGTISGDDAHSAVIPACWMTCCHFTMSCAMSSPNTAGRPPAGYDP